MTFTDDNAIIDLYWARNEEAIPATAEKYGKYCCSIAYNIIGSAEDTEECVNDTYLAAWNTIPPQRPGILSVFLGRITRNISVNRMKKNTAQKRGGGEFEAVLDELSECVSGSDSAEGETEYRELVSAVNEFLSAFSEKKRGIFLCRYWYSDSVRDIAKRFSMSEGAVTMTLRRMRDALRVFLTERGFDL